MWKKEKEGNCARDNDGLHGELRLWINKAEAHSCIACRERARMFAWALGNRTTPHTITQHHRSSLFAWLVMHLSPFSLSACKTEVSERALNRSPSATAAPSMEATPAQEADAAVVVKDCPITAVPSFIPAPKPQEANPSQAGGMGGAAEPQQPGVWGGRELRGDRLYI